MHNNRNLVSKIPHNVSYVTSTLENAGFEANLVGGCVRDLILGREPKDWDVTTNAKPEEIIQLFEKTVYENTFGTVAVCLPATGESKDSEPVTHETPELNVSRDTYNKNVPHETQKYEIIEVTPYRLEAKYSDFRHPDEVRFSNNIKDDLKRRDFTVNAMAMGSKGQIIDLFKGHEDLKDKILRTVGEADERFTEDALRMLRAVRFAVELGFSVSHETSESIVKNADLIRNISKERIRDEFIKIIMSPSPAVGVLMLHKFGLLKHIIPELEEGIGCEQGGAHVFDVWNHLLQALQHAADKGWSLEIRLSALFHDIGKPRTRRYHGQKHTFRHSHPILEGQERTDSSEDDSKYVSGPKKKYTFYGHEVVGAKMAHKIMERLKFPKKETDLVVSMVRNHMFFSDTEQITLSAVRRIIAKVGVENIWTLMSVRECDRVGMNKKEAPYRLRKYHAMIEEALHDPISVTQLNIDGNYLMNELHVKPGPRMGWILNALLEEVLDDASKNTVEHLSGLVKNLDMLGDPELRTLGERGKEKREELEEEKVSKLHEKHGVKK